jgi:hypothetical protein
MRGAARFWCEDRLYEVVFNVEIFNEDGGTTIQYSDLEVDQIYGRQPRSNVIQ